VERLDRAVSYEEDLLRRLEDPWPQARHAARQVLKSGEKKFPQAFPRAVEMLERLAREAADPSQAIAAAVLLARRGGGRAEHAPALRDALGKFSPEEIAGALESLSGEEPALVLRALVEERPEEWLDVVQLVWAGRPDSLREAGFSLLKRLRPELAPELVEECCRAPGRAPEAFCWLLERHLKGTGDSGLEPLQRRSARDLLVLTLDLLDRMVDRAQRGEIRPGPLRAMTKRLESLCFGGRGRGFFEQALEEASPADRLDIHHRLVRSAAHFPDVMSRPLEILGGLYPELAGGGPARPWEEEGALYVTAAGLASRREEYRHLVEEKLPRNFEAIGKAAAFGDLSENAEYTSALEERDRLTERAGHIKSELDRARVLAPEMVPAGEVGLGSKIRVEDLETGEESTFSVLGPWDGTPEEGVLNYRSPLGQVFLGHREGDEVTLELPGGTRRYRVHDVGSHFE
jgi:transcription elongation factor GreA